MAMRGLVEPECGGTNPLVRLTGQRADRARAAEATGHRAGQGLVTEFLEETRAAARPRHTFRMDSLLREMRELEGARLEPRAGPGVAAIAAAGDWAGEFVHTEQNVIDWSREYLALHPLAGPDPLEQHQLAGRGPEPVLWADEYLADVPVLEEAPRLQLAEFQQFVASVRPQQEEEQVVEQEQGQGMVQELEPAQAAQGRIACECDLQPPPAAEWAEEFGDLTAEDAARLPETAEGRAAYRQHCSALQ
jgi:hypothetical protein